VLTGGEINPVAVLEDADTATFINLLHSHGEVESDMAVNLRLYDGRGECVLEQKRWTTVPRHGVRRIRVADLLPPGTGNFSGHLALGFDADMDAQVPRHLQALAEYRTRASVARTMYWSDEWNFGVRREQRLRGRRPRTNQSCFRALHSKELRTTFALTNAGTVGHADHADVSLSLKGREGTLATTTIRLAPYETRFAGVCDLFPGLELCEEVAVLVVESPNDLANMAFTRHLPSGALSAEHFISIPAVLGGKVYWPAGA
jgi:hypothetical protein